MDEFTPNTVTVVFIFFHEIFHIWKYCGINLKKKKLNNGFTITTYLSKVIVIK